MKVIKRNGKSEEFELSKVRRSIANAANDAGVLLNESDLASICKMVEESIKVGNKEVTSSYEIFGIVVFKLKELDYMKVIKNYVEAGLGL